MTLTKFKESGKQMIRFVMKAPTEAGGKASVYTIHMQEEGHQTNKKKKKTLMI